MQLQDSKAANEQNAMSIISSLRIPESCLYSTLTKDLIQQCKKQPQNMDGIHKITFATKLAICEFKAAGIHYPKECKDNLHHEWETRKCVRKLEYKPQWWTTWSNCLQNIAVICHTVRGEAERGMSFHFVHVK